MSSRDNPKKELESLCSAIFQLVSLFRRAVPSQCELARATILLREAYISPRLDHKLPDVTSHLVQYCYMLEAYYHDNLDTEDNFTQPHNSGEPVSLEKLESIGVFYRHVTSIEDLNGIADQRGYKNRDTVKLNLQSFNNDVDAYNAQMKKFYKEHFHEDEEIRYILDGEGYFDVRDQGDRWIRTKLHPHDLLVLPAGIYHRFTLTDEKKYVQAIRLFKDEPKWEAINRDTNRASEAREEYVKSISV